MVRRKIGRRPGGIRGRTGKEVRQVAIVVDMLLTPIEGSCPRDRGLLTEAIGEPGVQKRCCLCGWRLYDAAAIAGALKTRAREEAATVRAQNNNFAIWNNGGAGVARHGRRDRVNEASAVEMDESS